MGLFSSESKIEKLRAEHAKIVFDLRNEINELKGVLAVKEKEVEFYLMRGDRYMASLKERNDEATQHLAFAKEILSKVIDSKIKTI